jgi:hypothetical protein
VIAHALGDITIPDNKWLHLELRAESESQRLAIRSLPKSGIHGLRIEGGTLDHATLASVFEMSSLEVLELRECRLTEDAFGEQRGLPKLTKFVSYADSSDNASTQMARWMRDCPQLEYVYCQPELSLSEWQQLVDHPKLTFVNVAIRHDAVEVLRTLRSLKHIQGLNLKVGPDATPEFAETLSGLDGVEWINWSGGRFGEREARSLAKLRGLQCCSAQNLRIANRCAGGMAWIG